MPLRRGELEKLRERECVCDQVNAAVEEEEVGQFNVRVLRGACGVRVTLRLLLSNRSDDGVRPLKVESESGSLRSAAVQRLDGPDSFAVSSRRLHHY